MFLSFIQNSTLILFKRLYLTKQEAEEEAMIIADYEFVDLVKILDENDEFLKHIPEELN